LRLAPLKENEKEAGVVISAVGVLTVIVGVLAVAAENWQLAAVQEEVRSPCTTETV
jgi:hypothetical protein